MKLPAGSTSCATSRGPWSASKRPRAGDRTTSPACKASWTTTGPRSSPLASGLTTRSPTGSTSSAAPTVATAGDLGHLDAGIPVDRATERDEARRQLADAVRARQQAEEALGSARAAFDESGRRRWGRKHQQEVATATAGVDFAEQRLERVAGAEGELRERFASLARHQQERQQALAAAATRREQFAATLAQFDAALDHSRADRVRALADDPPAYLVERLGTVPRSSAGRAVWCHHALGVEAVLDRNDGIRLPATGGSLAVGRARQEVAIADRLLHSSPDLTDPAGWAQLTGQAAALRNEAQRLMRARATIDRLLAPAQQVQPSRGMGDAAQQGPELSL